MIFEEKSNFYQGYVKSTKPRIGNDLVGEAKHLTDEEHIHLSLPSEMDTSQLKGGGQKSVMRVVPG